MKTFDPKNLLFAKREREREREQIRRRRGKLGRFRFKFKGCIVEAMDNRWVVRQVVD